MQPQRQTDTNHTHSHTLDKCIWLPRNQKQSQPWPCTWSELRGWECKSSHRWFLQMRTFIATRKAAQVKERQLTFLSCWTPPNILITPSISCSSLLAQYCILQEMEGKRERERERKREKESEPWHWVDKQGTEGEGRKSVPQLSSLLSAAPRAGQSTRNTPLWELQLGQVINFKTLKFMEKAPQREEGRKKYNKNCEVWGFIFSLYKHLQ